MESVEEIFQDFNRVTAEEASNVISKDSNNTLQYEQLHNVVVPPEEKKIAINVSSLRRVRKECERVKQIGFSYAELWLGISSLLIGAFFSAILSKISYELNLLSIFFYTICPIGGVGFGVAYFFCRNKNNQDIIQFAEKIEEYILDPEEMEDTHEY